MSMHIESEAMEPGRPIPVKYTADGRDVSPPLRWSEPPPGTKELALIVDDPDAPRAEPWVHWLIYRMAGNERSLREGVPQRPLLEDPAGAVQGKNSWGTVGYRGPAPPKGHGVHHYRFRLYALDAALPIGSGKDRTSLEKHMEGHVLEECELVATYERMAEPVEAEGLILNPVQDLG